MVDSGAGERVRLYLGYLEIEMTIMGILSAFCIATSAFVLKETLSAEKGFLPVLWARSGGYVIVGVALITGAALWFYRQRSELAWYHGQLCLSLQESTNMVINQTTKDLLEDADGWDTWVHYQRGFACLSAGMTVLLFGLVISRHPEIVGARGRVAGIGATLAVCGAAATAYGLYRRKITKA